MAIYGISIYAESVYGFTAPPQFSVDPFNAIPYDYSTINLSWVKPAGTITAWRLIKNMNGFPTDHNDGSIVVDSATGYPGNSFADINITPGAYHYYGFFVQVNTQSDLWVNAGSTGCLMLNNYNSSATMLNLIPGFYIESINNVDELQVNPNGNPFLNLFMAVFGWGLDYLRTQYDTYQNFNNAAKIPLGDLYNLAAQLGIDINPAISPYTLRKAVANNAVVNKTKGTLQGMATELAALTGWSSDLTIGPNILLSNDQSFFESPVSLEWTNSLDYNTGEMVQFDSFIYKCIRKPNVGQPPTGIATSNTFWQIQQNQPSTVLRNTATGGVSTWEGVYTSSPNSAFTNASLTELIGAQDPISTLHNTANVLQLTNALSGTTDMWIRSVARVNHVLNNPDKFQAIADGIPVPNVVTATRWDATVRYFPQDIVLYNNQPFRALRTSVNSVPPYTSRGTASEDWEPLAYDERLRLAVSSYVKGSSLSVVPFVEWYDSSGNFITRMFAKNAGSPPSLPSGICYDSFVTGVGQDLASYAHTDDGVYSWTTSDGGFSISPYANGCVYPTDQATRSVVTVDTGSANCQAGLTFVTNPVSNWFTGLVMRASSDTSYIIATQTELISNNAGTYTLLGTYSTPCIAGDRIVVTLNGAAISVARNGSVVLNVSNSFNQTATEFGIAYEQFATSTSGDNYDDGYDLDYGGSSTVGSPTDTYTATYLAKYGS